MAAWLILALMLLAAAVTGKWLAFAIFVILGVFMYREERAANGR